MRLSSTSQTTINGRLVIGLQHFIHQALDWALNSNGSDIYTLWKDKQQEVKNGAKKDANTFLSLAEQKTSKALIDRVKTFINSKLEKPKQTLAQLKK